MQWLKSLEYYFGHLYGFQHTF